MNRTEYDLDKAAQDRQLKNLELVDFGGKTLIVIPWKPQFVSFKVFYNFGDIFRFGFVFNYTAYYQRANVLDVTTLQPVKELNK